MTKRVLITGINGQDGSYLTDLLLDEGCEVHGLYRRSSVDNLRRLAHLRGHPRLNLWPGDVTDASSLEAVVAESQAEEVYHEADQDSVGWSAITPAYQIDTTVKAVVHLLEAVRLHIPQARVFLPCSAMMFGDPAYSEFDPDGKALTEKSPFAPASVYGAAKVAVHQLAGMYRRRHGMFVTCGILFNHDSPRRSEHYLLHKICLGARRIAKGEQQTIPLGNLDGKVDVGFSRDYMEAAIAMVRFRRPEDYVVASGQAHTVGELLSLALSMAGVQHGPRELEKFVTPDPAFTFKPRGVLWGSYEKALADLGWRPRTHIKALVKMILEAA